jgi:hypothetical protein
VRQLDLPADLGLPANVGLSADTVLGVSAHTAATLSVDRGIAMHLPAVHGGRGLPIQPGWMCNDRRMSIAIGRLSCWRRASRSADGCSGDGTDGRGCCAPDYASDLSGDHTTGLPADAAPAMRDAATTVSNRSDAVLHVPAGVPPDVPAAMSSDAPAGVPPDTRAAVSWDDRAAMLPDPASPLPDSGMRSTERGMPDASSLRPDERAVRLLATAAPWGRGGKFDITGKAILPSR